MMPEHKREIIQLWWVADHYFDLAEKRVTGNQLSPRDLQITVTKVGDKCETISDIENNAAIRAIMEINAHLGSCAVRLSTIDERLKSVRWECYKSLEKKRKRLDGNDVKRCLGRIVHFMLRHNVAHEEYHPTKNPAHEIMQDALMQLKIQELLDNISHVKKSIKADIEKLWVKI